MKIEPTEHTENTEERKKGAGQNEFFSVTFLKEEK
jgi:hypothetical protein